MKLNEIKNVNMVYHGSDTRITSFDIMKLGDNGNDQHGPGIYLVDDKAFAESYGKYVYTIQLLSPNFIKATDTLNVDELSKFIMASDRKYVTYLFQNYGYETLPHESELLESIQNLVQHYLSDDNKQETFLEIWGQSMYNFDKTPFMKLMVRFGYDGMEIDWIRHKVYAVYNTMKIKVINMEVL